MEIERKFIVARLPDPLDGHPAKKIDQGYLVIGADGSEVRVRRAATQHWLTVKRGAGLVRSETEVELSAEQFELLWPATEGARIEKTRYRLPAGDGLVIELDVYAGSLSGLQVAEVEFDDQGAARRFRPPAWFGREVTDDDRFKNRRLAVDGLPES